MTRSTGEIHGAISNHTILPGARCGEVATAAGDFGMGSFQRKPGFLMVEFQDLVSFRSVAVPAVSFRELSPMGVVASMAGRTEAHPSGLLQIQVIESAHGKDVRGMAEVTPRNGEGSLVWILGLMANGASVGIIKTELKPSIVPGFHLMTFRAWGDGMGSTQLKGRFNPMPGPVKAGWYPGALRVACIAMAVPEHSLMGIQMARSAGIMLGDGEGPPGRARRERKPDGADRGQGGAVACLAAGIGVGSQQWETRGAVVEN
jgi:hypothetical protein